ncbi:MAG: NAD-dependent epimerase/dehydratase family protein [Spirochaetaceae bacterium]|nr:MAG: NAD-dependent epimerase/dehydratase family protein [Spirochaetaceae bacterium]
MNTEQRSAILVVGGSGVVGRHVCREVIRTLGPDALVVGDHKPERGREFAVSFGPGVRSVAVDVDRREAVEQALDEAATVGAVIVTARQREPNVQIVCTNRGIHSVDIVPDTPAINSTVHGLCGLVAAGLIPGLSGLMAHHVLEEMTTAGVPTTEQLLHVSLLQRKNGTAGPAGIVDMLGMFAQPVRDGDREVPGFTRTRTVPFPLPFGERKVRRVAFPEAGDVQRRFGVASASYWTAFDDNGFNRLISAANRLGLLRRLNRPGRSGQPGGRILRALIAREKRVPAHVEETVALTAEAGGPGGERVAAVRLTAPSDYTGTAMAAVAMARELITRGSPDYGVVFPFALFTLEQIVTRVGSPELQVWYE